MNYKISNQTVTAEFHTLGGELTSIRYKGLEYLWQGDKTYWGGQAPVLFPIVGSLRDKRATAGGKICRMERHGVARRKEFVLKENNDRSISFVLHSDSETKERYPFDFELEIQYTLVENRLETSYTVYNPGDETLPFQIGGHPAFRCPIGGNESFEEYLVEFERSETAQCPQLDPAGLVDLSRRKTILDHTSKLPLTHQMFESDALIFDNLQSRKVRMYHPVSGLGVEMEFRDFNYFLVWSSANGGPFVALEPWTGLSTCSDEKDVLEEKRGVILLPPNQKKTFQYTIVLLG